MLAGEVREEMGIEIPVVVMGTAHKEIREEMETVLTKQEP